MNERRIPPILIYVAACCVLTIFGAIIGGFGMYRYAGHQGKIEDAGTGLITDKIAVVNLDEGTVVQDEEINYANRLLINLKDNFLFTGLEDARQGYATGIYASYVVIPANFSRSVVSLNDTPVRAEITYAINNELRKDVKEQVIYDVLEMANNLDDNVSYMYIHSVLDDLHTAQDEAGTIMDNDLKEKEAINAVQAYDLVALVPVTELTEIENTIESVDIAEYLSKNAKFAGEIGLKYTEYLMASEAEHRIINEEAMELMNEMDNMNGIMSGINFIQSGEEGSVYQLGTEELDGMFEEYNTLFEEAVTEQGKNIIKIYQDINLYLDEYDRALEAHRSRNSALYLNTLDKLEELFDSYKDKGYTIVSEQEIQSMKARIQEQDVTIARQQSLIEELEQREQQDSLKQEEEPESDDKSIQDTDANDAEEAEPESEQVGLMMLYVDVGIDTSEVVNGIAENSAKDELTELQKSIVKILEGNNYYVFGGTLLDEDGNPVQDKKGEYVPLTSILDPYEKELYLDNGDPDKKIMEEILEEQLVEFERMDTERVVTCIEEKILTPIQENVDAVVTAVLDQYAVEQEQLMTYNEAIMEYNPLEYIDHEEIQSLTDQMMDNGTSLSEAVLETDIQQMEYVTNVYAATRNDLFTLQDNIAAAKEDSDKAVEEGLQDLKNTKNANSTLNQAILDDFSNKLPYTRLGSLEYVQAYEFMVNPVGRIDMGPIEKIPRTQQDSVRSANDNINVEERKKADTRNVSMIICVMICVIIVSATIKYHFHKKQETYEVE